MHPSVAALLTRALTGHTIEPTGEVGTVADLLAQMARAGWPAELIRLTADRRLKDGDPWPYPVDRTGVGVGAAQWYALLAQARDALGLTVTAMPPSRRVTLTADERRLLAERPPHHGPVG